MRCETDTDSAATRDLVDGLTDPAPTCGVSSSDPRARVGLDTGLPTKELAPRLGHDASFVTGVADALKTALNTRDLIRRGPSLRNRWVKNLRRTPEGVATKERLIKDGGARMPWNTGVDSAERHRFRTLPDNVVGDDVTTEQPTAS
jgi:hypothetical protein